MAEEASRTTTEGSCQNTEPDPNLYYFSKTMMGF